MQKPQVLVVDDDLSLRKFVKAGLEDLGIATESAANADEAEKVLAARPSLNLMLLDVMMPGRTGWEFIQDLRESGNEIPVIFLTARQEVDERIKGLKMGADDYMKKPFSPRELVARVEAQFRRGEMDSAPPAQIELPGDIQVDLARLEVHRDGQVIPLTPREGDILAYLIKHHDRVVTREDLLLDVWHYASANVETRTVDIHIVGLRRKVEVNPSEPELIQTVRGKGYRWYD